MLPTAHSPTAPHQVTPVDASVSPVSLSLLLVPNPPTACRPLTPATAAKEVPCTDDVGSLPSISGDMATAHMTDNSVRPKRPKPGDRGRGVPLSVHVSGWDGAIARSHGNSSRPAAHRLTHVNTR